MNAILYLVHNTQNVNFIYIKLSSTNFFFLFVYIKGSFWQTVLDFINCLWSVEQAFLTRWGYLLKKILHLLIIWYNLGIQFRAFKSTDSIFIFETTALWTYKISVSHFFIMHFFVFATINSNFI